MEGVVVDYKGYNGTISADHEQLTIVHSGMAAKAARLPCDQPRAVPLGAVSGVRLSPATHLVNGALTLGLGGADAVNVGSQAAADPNTVMFRHGDNAQFTALYEWLVGVVAANKAAGVDSAAMLTQSQPTAPIPAATPPDDAAAPALAEDESATGEKPGFFARRRELKHANEASRDAFESTTLEAAKGDEVALAALPARIDEARGLYKAKDFQQKLWDAMAVAVRGVIDDDVLTSDEEEHLHRLGDLLGTPIDQMQARDQQLFEELVIAGINDGRFPALPNPTILLKRGEAAYGSFAASLMKDQAIREFRGGSSSVSIPLGHGLRYRVGGVRGRSVVVGTQLVVQDAGLLTVTSQRTVFTGRTKTLEFRNDKLVGLEQFTDGLRLNVSNRQTASLFRVNLPSVAAALITASVARST